MRVIALTVLLTGAACSPAAACIRCEADDPEIRREAEQGDARAEYVLAWMYATGYQADKSDRQSFLWLRKAADKGYEHAVLRLGEYYLQGRGVGQDTRRAIELLEKAAALFRGGEAAGLLADIHGTGKYGAPDRVSAYRWLSLSDRKNKAAALKELEGSMTPKEIMAAKELARDWFERNKDNPLPKSYDSVP